MGKEFDESLGYVHNDIEAICAGTETLNYTVALLAGIACEVLEDARAYANKVTVLEELLPDSDWKKLARPLFEALRHGLAHNFDTKHIHVAGKIVQICLSWGMEEMIRIKPANGEDGLFVSTRLLGTGVCQKIRDFKIKLQNDPEACRRFKESLDSGRSVKCDSALWNVLKNKQ